MYDLIYLLKMSTLYMHVLLNNMILLQYIVTFRSSTIVSSKPEFNGEIAVVNG